MPIEPEPTPELSQALKEYESIFGDFPPIFGYPEDDLLPALQKSINDKTALPGYDDIINK